LEWAEDNHGFLGTAEAIAQRMQMQHILEPVGADDVIEALDRCPLL